MNPFDENDHSVEPVEGLSSSDVKRRISLLTERTKHLYDVISDMSVDIAELKKISLAKRKASTAKKD